MSGDTSLLETLSSFTQAAQSAIQGLPEASTLLPPENGISLLDAKNEIFLSYLQGLALRNLNVIRSLKSGSSLEDAKELSDDITANLLEHRVYLERGIRPLEQKIKFQVDKAVKAAGEEDRVLAQKQNGKNGRAVNGHAKDGDEDTSDSDEDEESEDEADAQAQRPSAARIVDPQSHGSEDGPRARSAANAVYRPPRVSATTMPTTEQRERKERRPARSATLDEYVNTELSNAPLAEPSIGSTIAANGRKTKDYRQLAREQERRDYEETHLMRLPKESKKERAKQSARERRGGGFGGEEWRGLGESVDRIGDLTRRKNKDSASDKSRKRRAVEDSPRGDGIGDAFNIKKRRVMKKMRR